LLRPARGNAGQGCEHAAGAAVAAVIPGDLAQMGPPGICRNLRSHGRELAQYSLSILHKIAAAEFPGEMGNGPAGITFLEVEGELPRVNFEVFVSC
jgi:hypothetical protein